MQPSRSIRIFDIPELAWNIARYLSPHDIAQCILVSRFFQALFWSFLYGGLTAPLATKDLPNIWSAKQWTGATPVETPGVHANLRVDTNSMEARRLLNLVHIRSEDVRSLILSVFELLLSVHEGEVKAKTSLSSSTSSSCTATDIQRPDRPFQLHLDFVDQSGPRLGLNRLYPCDLVKVELLIPRLLRYHGCRPYLTVLCLPAALLDFSGVGHQLPWRKFLSLIETERLKTLTFYGSGVLQKDEARAGLIFVNNLLSTVRTLETLDFPVKLDWDAEDQAALERLMEGWIFPVESRLKRLSLYLSGWTSETVFNLVLRSHGAVLERLCCTITSLGHRGLGSGQSVSSLGFCRKLWCLSLDISLPEDHGIFSLHLQDKAWAYSTYFKAPPKDATMTMASGGQSPSKALTTLRLPEVNDLQPTTGLRGLLRLLDFKLLEEVMVDRLLSPPTLTKLEECLTVHCPHLSTFSVDCDRDSGGYLRMETLFKETVPSWPCSDTLRVLKLTVGRATVDLDDLNTSGTVNSFYRTIGQCRQLEELAIGYAVYEILRDYYGILSNPGRCRVITESLNTRQFKDLLLPPLAPTQASSPSLPAPAPLLVQPRTIGLFGSRFRRMAPPPVESETGSLHHLAGLSKLRVLSLTRSDLWSRMGQREVEFMAEHWPKLQTIEIATNALSLQLYRGRPQWQWLLQRRLGLDLVLYSAQST
ncbi:hypothetical protein EMPS_07121 [Entomortierella parvispora]|uniref:F-box domain-containing protein n=1 Tax=Entomortierella parvispora TaxID=205924 RepID=A0A9P3HEA8_9FUNG|nr:hypothetical protein EMPS_07121 [Entomortierella parvispora]